MNTSRISKSDMQNPAFKEFVKSMVDRQYGAEETLDAWLWFLCGWNCARWVYHGT